MAWYEAHQTMAKHPKTLKLARLLKADRRYAVGLLHDLFSWGLDTARKDGTLPGLEAEDIAVALDTPGKKGLSAVSALVESGYLECGDDGTYCIHDWYDYAGKLMDKRETDKKRQAENRRKKLDTSDDSPRDIRVTSGGNPIATVPNLTVPYHAPNLPEANFNLLSPTSRSQRAPAREETRQDSGFERFWAAYPRKTGDIQRAATAYLCAVDDGAKLEDMLAALVWQREQEAWVEQGGRFIPSPEKWLQNRGWMQEKPKAPPPRRESGNATPPEPNPEAEKEKLEAMKRMYAKMHKEAENGD